MPQSPDQEERETPRTADGTARGSSQSPRTTEERARALDRARNLVSAAKSDADRARGEKIQTYERRAFGGARYAVKWAAQPEWATTLADAIDAAHDGASLEAFGADRWRRLVGSSPDVAFWDDEPFGVASWEAFRRRMEEQPNSRCLPPLDTCREACCDLRGSGPIGPRCAHYGHPVFAACFRGEPGTRYLSHVFFDCPVERRTTSAEVEPSCLEIERVGAAGAATWDCSSHSGGVGIQVENECAEPVRFPDDDRVVQPGDSEKLNGDCESTVCEISKRLVVGEGSDAARHAKLRVRVEFRIPEREGFEHLDRTDLFRVFGFSPSASD